ncbi:hypothetical protein M3Y94_00698300 [Aphelenchoides besseyi]|nr:hypothetical protein M3Y94_00698300 [Aphelenchoides besseyi]
MRPTRRAATVALERIKKKPRERPAAPPLTCNFDLPILESSITSALENDTSPSAHVSPTIVLSTPPSTIPVSPMTIPASPNDTVDSVQLIQIVPKKPKPRNKESKRRRGTMFHLKKMIKLDEDDEDEVERSNEMTHFDFPTTIEESQRVSIPLESTIVDPNLPSTNANNNNEEEAKIEKRVEMATVQTSPQTYPSNVQHQKKMDKTKPKPNVYFKYEMQNGKRRRVFHVQTIHPSLNVQPTASSLKSGGDNNGESKKTRWRDDETGGPLHEERNMTLLSEQFGHNFRATTRKKEPVRRNSLVNGISLFIRT